MKLLLSLILSLILLVTFSLCSRVSEEFGLNIFDEINHKSFEHAVHSALLGFRDMFYLKVSHYSRNHDTYFRIYTLGYLTLSLISTLTDDDLTSVEAYSNLLVPLIHFSAFDVRVNKREILPYAFFTAVLAYLIKFPLFSFIGNSVILFVTYILYKKIFHYFFYMLHETSEFIGTKCGIQSYFFYNLLTLDLINGYRAALFSVFMSSTCAILHYLSSLLFVTEANLAGHTEAKLPESPSQCFNGFFTSDTTEKLIKKAYASASSFVVHSFTDGPSFSRYIPMVLASTTSLVSSLVTSSEFQEQTRAAPIDQNAKILNGCNCEADKVIETRQMLNENESTVAENISSDSFSSKLNAVVSGMALFVCSFLLL